jgi:hypothetical protein
MPHISYMDPATVDDPEPQAIMERARLYGTPRPESQAIRLHHPEVMKAFNNAWEVFFRQGVADHAIKELCRPALHRKIGRVRVLRRTEVGARSTARCERGPG